MKDFKVMHISEVSQKGNQKLVKMTKEEWLAKGKELFGPDYFQWRFVCPACGNIASPNDYIAYRDKGAKPNSATCECIGRYSGNINVPMGGGPPCNYAGYGLLHLSPVIVSDEGKEIRCFAFCEIHGEGVDGKEKTQDQD